MANSTKPDLTAVTDPRYDDIFSIRQVGLSHTRDRKTTRQDNLPFYNVKHYGAKGDGITDDRAAIQSLIDTVFTAGGGVIFFPAGTYIMSGTGTASQGCLRAKNNVNLQGSGIGVTTLKVKDGQTADITGIIRTPSGESTANVTISDFTMDGNRSGPGNTASVIGFYCGVSPGIRITSITRSSSTATATIPSGHGLANGNTVIIQNADQTEYNGSFTISNVTSTTFDYTVTGTPITPATGKYIYYPNLSLTQIYDYDIGLYRVHIKNCSSYGFDPHERTKRLYIIDCLASNNGLDGFVADYIEDSKYMNCISYNNDRHGYNLTTTTNNFQLYNCTAHDNGAASGIGNGIIIQRGSSDITFPNNIGLKACDVYSNNRAGVLAQMVDFLDINNCRIYNNGREGIKFAGVTYSTVSGNILRNNSQTTHNTYDSIMIDQYDDSGGASATKYGSRYNLIANNFVIDIATNKCRNSLRDDNDTDSGSLHTDYNLYMFNRTIGSASGDISIGSSNTNSSVFNFGDTADGWLFGSSVVNNRASLKNDGLMQLGSNNLQTTVGTAGTASTLPSQPEGYFIIKDSGGTKRAVAYYKQS